VTAGRHSARSATPVRALVADDHPLYRDGLVRILRQEATIEVIAEAADGRTALDQLRELQPDVAVLDLGLPHVDGLAIIDTLRREGRKTRALLISAKDDSATVYRAIGAGADGYLSKSSGADEIVWAVLAVARGDTWISASLQTGLAGEIRMRRPVDQRPMLSARELEVLRLVADGLSATEIGERLHLARTTIRTHLQHIYEKFGVSDRTSAVAHAMRHGLLH
jgi:two-component system nitrate/nitrite response regulator NarL